MRESPAFALMDKLELLGCEVAYYDPHIAEIGPTREHAHRKGMKSVEWNEQVLRSFDAAVVVTAHRATNHEELACWCNCIVDSRNVIQQKPGVWPA